MPTATGPARASLPTPTQRAPAVVPSPGRRVIVPESALVPGSDAASRTLSPAATRPPAEEESGFAALLRSTRVRAGLTQKALADLSTISPRAIRDLESGRANARVQTVLLLADGLRLKGLVRELFIQAGLSGRRTEPGEAELGLRVPRPVNAILGRDTEIRVMIDVLESGRRRMVSLSGLPGVGKTRVAGEIAARLAAKRGWPVLWVGPSARSPEAGGASPLLRSLRRLLTAGAEDAARVVRLIGRHEALIVFDGAAAERVPAGVEDLLAYCPNVRVISTSRAPWQLTGVQSAVIAPLPVPAAEYCRAPAAELCTGLASVRLLVERLSEVKPGYALGSEDAAAAASLCRRLDGLPAALEAVAGFFRVLPLRRIARASAADLLGLAVPGRDPAGATTLGALLSSSIDTLGERRRAVLRELVRPRGAGSVGDLALALERPQHEIVDDLSVLIGRGLVHAPTGEATAELRVPNLLRALLGRTPEPPRTVPEPDPAAYAWH